MRRVDPLRGPSRLRDRESGAALVEFALILPVFMILLLGMFTGALAYSRRVSVAGGAREGARFGATLPSPGTGAWLNQVAAVTMGGADSELDTNKPGRFVCVAYVDPAGVASRVVFDPGNSVGTLSAQRCLTPAEDTRTEPRVQVVARRVSTLEALVFSTDLTLSSRAVARFEAQ